MATDEEYLAVAMERTVAMEKLAVKETSSAVDHPWYTSTQFPYWVNYVSLVTPEEAVGTQLNADEYIIKMRLVVAHFPQGDNGVLQRKLWVWIPQVLEFFKARPQLQYQKNQQPVRYLDANGCRIRLSRGFAIFQDSPGPHMGTEFDLIARFEKRVEKAF